MIAPMQCPTYGVTLPCQLVEIRDGDTIVVAIRGMSLVWAIRLIDCWCPETNRGEEKLRKLGRAGSEYARQVLHDGPNAGDLRVHIPLPEIAAGTEGVNLLSFLTFDRIPGYLYVGPHQTLNRLLVLAGLASSTKGGPLGK